MALAVQELRQMPSARWSESDLIADRNVRQVSLQTWKDGIETLDAIMAGDWASARGSFGAGNTYTKAEEYDSSLKIQNYIHDSMLDIKRVACESRASLRCDVLGRSQDAADAARLLEAIGSGYWESGTAADFEPNLVMDFIGAGGAFVLSYPKVIGRDAKGNQEFAMYPRHRRLNPRNVLPTLDADADDEMGQLSDCMVVYKMNVRKASARWPELMIEALPLASDDVEVIEYYTAEQWIKCVRCRVKSGPTRSPVYADQGYIVEVQDAGGIMPVAHAKMPTFDGAWRGIMNQAGPVMDYHNRIRTLMLDNAEEATYSALVKLGVVSGTYGPRGEMELDPAVPNARVEKVGPSAIQGGLFGLEQRLEQDARNTLGAPQSRAGVVSQSIASGSFVEATQGAMSSLVKEAQNRGIASLRRRQTDIDYRIDRAFLDYEKPLIVPAGDLTMYHPTDDIPDPDVYPYRVRFEFGLLSGVDSINRTTQLLQLSGGQLISLETARANVDHSGGNDWRNEEQKILREQTLRAFAQYRLANPQFPTEMMLQFQDEGMTFEQAASKVSKELAKQQAEMAAQLQQGAPGGPIQTPTAPEPGAQAASLGAGGIPGAPSGTNQAGQPGQQPALPPLTSVVPPQILAQLGIRAG